MAANLKFFCIYAFKLAFLTSFQSKHSFEYQLQNEASNANLNSHLGKWSMTYRYP